MKEARSWYNELTEMGMNTMLIGIILGHRLSDDGTGSSRLYSRLDSALLVETRFHPDRWIVSGGMANPKAGISEAAVMRDYLLAHGISEDRILVEDQSRSTRENARFALEIARRCSADSLLLITSSDHLTRWVLNPIRLFAKEIGSSPISLMAFTECSSAIKTQKR